MSANYGTLRACATLHLGLEDLFQAGAHFLVSQEFPAVELLKTARHFLPEPYIVIEIVFHELLHVFVGAARDVRGNAV